MFKKSLLFLSISTIGSTAFAVPLTPGNLLIQSDDSIYEYTVDGSYQQQYTVTRPSARSTEYARDIVAHPDGKISVYNGTFEPVMSTYDPTADSWQHTEGDFSTVNNGSYGGIDVFEDTVFVTDQRTSGSPNQGIVAFNSSGEHRFATDISPIDLSVGLNGLLYALTPGGSPSGRVVNVYDTITFNLVDSYDLTSIFGWTEHRAVAVDAQGDLYIADWDGEVHHVSKDGVLIDTVKPICDWLGREIQCNFIDIDVSQDGLIALGSRFGEVFVTDTSFSYINTFDVGDDNIFVEFTPYVTVVSVIGMQFLFGLGILSLVASRRQRFCREQTIA